MFDIWTLPFLAHRYLSNIATLTNFRSPKQIETMLEAGLRQDQSRWGEYRDSNYFPPVLQEHPFELGKERIIVHS